MESSTYRHAEPLRHAPPRDLRRLRSVVASLASLAAAIAWYRWDGTMQLPSALLVPTLLLVLAAPLLWARSLPAQLFARASLWSSLLVAVLVGCVGHERELAAASRLGLACSVALLAAGRIGLYDDGSETPFRPLAIRGLLQTSIVMAFADVQALALFIALCLETKGVHSHRSTAALPWMLAMAALLTIAAIGIYRLARWGVPLAMLAAFVLALAGVTDSFKLGTEVGALFALSGVAQLLVSFAGIVAGQGLEHLTPMSDRARSRFRLVPALTVLLLLGIILARAGTTLR